MSDPAFVSPGDITTVWIYESGLMFASPVSAIFAGVVLCGMTLIVLNVSVPELPASVNV